MTQIRRFDAGAIAAAALAIGRAEPVGIPTETVYGLAADARSDRAVAAIFAAKQRPAFNPLIVHVANLSAAAKLGDFSTMAVALAEIYWPGPLTIVVPYRAEAGISGLATAGLDTIALRVPAHRAMQALLEATGAPLAAPSANISGGISPTTADHVRQSLGDRIALIIDDGPTRSGIESTIVAIDGDTARVLRPGPIVIGALAPAAESMITAPGQLASHYAPGKPLRLNVIQPRDNEFAIGFGHHAGVVNLSPTADLVEAAANLFAMLWQGDMSAYPGIAVAPIPDHGIGIAINDRLRRAAHDSGR